MPGYIVTGRWGSCDTAEMRQHGSQWWILSAPGPGDIRPPCCQLGHHGGLAWHVTGPSWGPDTDIGGPGEPRGKEGVSPLSGEVQEEGVTRGKCPVNIMRESGPATSGHHTHTGGQWGHCQHFIENVYLIWGASPPLILSFEDWVSIMTCTTQTRLDTSRWRTEPPVTQRWTMVTQLYWVGFNYIDTTQSSVSQPITIRRARTHTTQICARLVGCEGWLGLDGGPLSLSTGHMVSLTPDVPPAPLWPISP